MKKPVGRALSAMVRISHVTAYLTILLLLLAAKTFAQLPPPNEMGVSSGHIHYMVTDLDGHLDMWQKLGGRRGEGYVIFPGIHVRVTEVAEALAASIETTANHVGFSVQDYPRYRSILLELGAQIFYENEADGQLLADLPDGVRVEILTDPQQPELIRFHHMHLVADDPEALRDWYGEVFGAEPGVRRGLPAALLPGGEVDIMGVMGDAPRPSQEGVLHHIGFEVADMAAFAERLEALGISFDMSPRYVESIDLTVAFITDPAGTHIEITQGLVDF